MMSKLTLIGELSRDDDGNVSIIQTGNHYSDTLSVEIGDFIEKTSNRLSEMYSKEIDEDLGYRICTNADNVQLRYYISDSKIISQEDIQEKYLQKILGSIDISVENIRIFRIYNNRIWNREFYIRRTRFRKDI